MLGVNLKTAIKRTALIFSLFISACGGAGGSGTQPTTNVAIESIMQLESIPIISSIPLESAHIQRGHLVFNGVESLALGGSQYLSLVLDGPITESAAYDPIQLSITSSDSSIIEILENNCNGKLTEESRECTIFVRGNSIGNASINIDAVEYPLITQPITVARQWGVIGGQSSLSTIDYISVSSNNIFMGSHGDILKSTNGSAWQEVGDGPAIVIYGYYKDFIASEANNVCIVADIITNNSVMVKCSINNSTWQQLPAFMSDINLIGGISIYNDTVYVTAYMSDFNDFVVFTCPLTDCIQWQQHGQTFNEWVFMTPIIYNGVTYIRGEDGIYYQDTDGNWKLYGKINIDNTTFITASATTLGIFFIPTDYNQSHQNVYYHSPDNLGSDFIPIGGVIPNWFNVGSNPFAVTVNNNVFVQLGSGIWTSTKNGNNWSSWAPFSDSSVAFDGIYTNGKQLYTHVQDGDQIYVYTLP